MIQHSIGTNEVKMSFYAHTGATDLFFLTVFFSKHMAIDLRAFLLISQAMNW